MTNRPILLTAILPLCVAALCAPAAGQDRLGRLSTLPHGTYLCSLPGDAGGPAWIELPDHTFAIKNSSTYSADGGAGTYLLTGKRVTFTGGPMKGARFERTGSAKLQKIKADGTLGRVRCIRMGGSG